MIGNMGIVVSFLSAAVSCFLFFWNAVRCSDNNLKTLNYARFFYHGHFAGIFAASGFLLYSLLTHQFQYYYVFAHSSTDLPFWYLVSAFWAGQEGTYMLWALITSLAGYVFMEKENKLVSAIMPFILLSQLFLLFFLILENPFFHLGEAPAEGMGLNPLLMDPWMVIHPPIIFIGYALLIIPFAYSAASLWKKDQDSGFLRVFPWAVAGWAFLGLGIVIGGAWAYRVLGWGGYWAWDPVENASLVPWLAATALVHGLIGQKVKGSYRAANHLLSFSVYLLVILATFLTRSGAMADYSVHAFAETTLTYALSAYLIIFTMIAAVLFILNLNSFRASGKDRSDLISRKTGLSLTMLLLVISGILIMLGTLSPVITGLFGNPASVTESYYLKVNGPLYFLTLLILAICPILNWEKDNLGSLIRTKRVILYIAPLPVAAAYFTGMNTVVGLLFSLVIYFVIAINLPVLYQSFRRKIIFTGAHIAHLGLALLIFGVVGSTVYSESKMVILPADQPVEVMGYVLSFLGIDEDETGSSFSLKIEDNGRVYNIKPRIYSAGGRTMRSPAVERTLLYDLYISPVEWQPGSQGINVVLSKGESYRSESFTLTFIDFVIEPHSDSGFVEVGALSIYENENESNDIVPLLRQDESGWSSVPVTMGADHLLKLASIDADRGLAQFIIEEIQLSSASTGKFIVEIKIIPLVSALIIGSLMLVLGTFIALWQRFTE